ncbi:MAG TPA: carboxypeptidase-like regulatory domain-containing protein [Micromonosporaceae bacterium]|nr:carboxypeptidase-like regulatory domain-containing protein [Micromonosporaceae bacterium]
MRRAGVVVALVAGALVAVPASPATAAPPDVEITSLSSGTLTSGQRATVTFKVTNTNAKPPGSDTANIKVTSSFGELTCEGQCDFSDQIPREGDQQFTATLLAGNVPPGETRSGKIEIRAEINGEASTTQRDMSVRGPQPQQPQQPQTVKEISGRVTDIRTGEGVPGAIVAISDSGDHRYDTITDDSGRYRFAGSAEKPITPGEILIGAQKDDVRVTKTITVGAGKSMTDYRLALRMSAPAPTASPSQNAAPSTEPTLATADPADSGAAAAPETAATGEDSGGFGSLLLILLGGLLIALGVGAIVLLWLRRKDSDGEDDGVPAGPGGRPVRPAYAGTNDATRLAGPGAAAPTMAGGMALADAPTMLHNRPVVDEFPDPYGAPLPPPQPPTYPGQPAWGEGYGEAAPTQAGYGPAEGRPASGGGYGAVPSPGGGYGSPASAGGGYGAAGGAFGAAAGSGGYGPHDQGDRHTQAGGWGRDGGYDNRYDEPTGRFGGGDGPGYGRGGHEPDPYGDAEPGYGQSQRHSDAGGYSGRDGYRGADSYDDRGGYDRRGGYGDDRGGYDPGSYDRSGYDQRGYERVPEQRDAGYDNRGYDRGGYAEDPAGQSRRAGSPSGRSERRSPDWLDD